MNKMGGCSLQVIHVHHHYITKHTYCCKCNKGLWCNIMLCLLPFTMTPFKSAQSEVYFVQFELLLNLINIITDIPMIINCVYDIFFFI